MKTNTLNVFLLALVITLSLKQTYSQVGINTTTPTDGTVLDIESTDKGIIIPRVALTGTTTQAPVTSTGTLTDGVLVYNTNSNGTGSTAVIPGFYYWEINRWIPLTGNNGKDWSVTGNSGTNPTTNFIGTLDNVDFRIRTNNIERMRFSTAGTAGIGTGTFGGVGLSILNAGFSQALYTSANSNIATIFNDQLGTGTGLFSRAVSGFGVHGVTTGGSAVRAQAGTGGTGVFATASTGPGIWSSSTSGTGVQGVSTSGFGLRGTSVSNVGISGFSTEENGIFGTTAKANTGIVIAGVTGLGTATNGTNGVLGFVTTNPTDGSSTNVGVNALSGSVTAQTGNYRNVGVSTNGQDLGIYSLTKLPISTTGNLDSGYFVTNFTGDATTADINDPIARLAGYRSSVNISTAPGGPANSEIYYGAYLYSGGNGASSSYAYSGARYRNTNYKIVGNGAVSTIVEDANGNTNRKTMFASEAPEVLFEDYGEGTLVNGTAQIDLDPIFSRNIVVDTNHKLKVFIQLEGDCKGVYVTNKSINGFSVKELQGGNSNITFSWHVVANRKDAVDENGVIVSKFADLRFPDAPQAIEPGEIKTSSLPKIKEDNTNIEREDPPVTEPKKGDTQD